MGDESLSGSPVSLGSGNKKIIIGVVAVVVIGLLVGGYFMFFAEPSSIEGKFRRDLKPVLRRFNNMMESAMVESGFTEGVRFTTEIIELKESGSLYEAVVNTDISALGQEDTIGVSKYYYDPEREEIVNIIMVGNDGAEDVEYSLAEFNELIDMTLAELS